MVRAPLTSAMVLPPRANVCSRDVLELSAVRCARHPPGPPVAFAFVSLEASHVVRSALVAGAAGEVWEADLSL